MKVENYCRAGFSFPEWLITWTYCNTNAPKFYEGMLASRFVEANASELLIITTGTS